MRQLLDCTAEIPSSAITLSNTREPNHRRRSSLAAEQDFNDPLNLREKDQLIYLAKWTECIECGFFSQRAVG
jgi:hypothetical protein